MPFNNFKRTLVLKIARKKTKCSPGKNTGGHNFTLVLGKKEGEKAQKINSQTRRVVSSEINRVKNILKLSRVSRESHISLASVCISYSLPEDCQKKEEVCISFFRCFARDHK